MTNMELFHARGIKKWFQDQQILNELNSTKFQSVKFREQFCNRNELMGID